jgi:hypothetical protein
MKGRRKWKNFYSAERASVLENQKNYFGQLVALFSKRFY